MENIKLIISDIDGTILDSNHQIDSQLPEIMKKMKNRDIPLVLASARSPIGMLEIADKLGLYHTPLACYNGALIGYFDKNKIFRIISEETISKVELRKILKILSENFPQISVNLYSKTLWLVEEENKWTKIEAEIVGTNPQITNFEGKSAHKLLVIGENEDIYQLLKKLKRSQFNEVDFYLSKDNYLEITSNKVSKEHALKEIAKYYGVPLFSTMAIGDNFNDVPMLESAGLGVAMGNSPQEVKNIADYISQSNDHSGVSSAVKKFLFN
ncbi:Cof-type HAD-IIB family hydrolase [Lactococcus sp. NH2-7C]|uniref:Cof-type HAD-IIB family hydrolase n=1 Tax=Lactococcus sp. NH2-7C TaxID=2879149 RepID=UPI001CDD7CBB|nr:Cof-type HAD-IIB family hydrolase [Lactococcus sp. NH2-7C]MCA2390750.1 Cof-type HAD-IIB family hydrolase [Lactococcus sp. NH2-7C]WGV30891.1 Cof-type HAD-IIB family hydrolase [Lactococcus sp. NH2-7C]